MDEALASFVNTYPEHEKMKILFLRESEGVYQFGQRRVHIKVEKGGQVFVRVGGGFMHVRDFIEEFTPHELEKLQRSDAVTRFRTQMRLQSIAARQASHSVEPTPIGRHVRTKSALPTLGGAGERGRSTSQPRVDPTAATKNNGKVSTRKPRS